MRILIQSLKNKLDLVLGLTWRHRIKDDRIEKYGSLFVFISK